MCAGPDRLLLFHEARVVADRILGDVLRVPVAKAISINTPSGFDRAAALLASKLRKAAGSSDLDAVRDAVRILDIDWTTTTAEERRRLIARSLTAAGRSTAMIPARIEAPLDDAANEIVSATRADVRRSQRLAIGAKLNSFDRRVIRHVVTSQSNFIRNEYGERVDAFGEAARNIVATGLEQGLGRADIAKTLEQAARKALITRSPWYWDVIASAFTGQARSWGQVSSYAEARIQRYQVSAVLDEATTDTCRFLNGKTFSVASALDTFDRVERLSDPEGIKQVMPWIRERLDPESGRVVLHAGGTRLAEITRSAVGSRDDAGEFRPFISDTKLADAVPGPPPYHGACRSSTLAVI